MAIGAILAALLGAGGSVAGGLLQKTPRPNQTGGIVGTIDPLSALFSQEALLGIGQFDPLVAQRSSPFNQALANFANAPLKAKIRNRTLVDTSRILGNLFTEEGLQSKDRARLLAIQNALAERPDLLDKSIKQITGDPREFTPERIAEIRNGIPNVKDPTRFDVEPNPAIADLLTQLGSVSREDAKRISKEGFIQVGDAVLDASEFAILEQFSGSLGLSLEELINSEQAFRVKRTEEAPRLEQLSAEIQPQRDALLKQFFNIAGDLPDVSAAGIDRFASLEKDRILRNLDTEVGQASTDALRSANVGGFNPGRQLGELAKFKANATQNADLDAFNRALQIIGGQQQLAAGGLSTITGALNPSENALGLAQIRSANIPTAPGNEFRAIAPSSNALGGAIGAAGNTAALIGLDYLSRRSEGNP